MKWSNDLNVKFTSNIHKDLNFEYSGSNALSSAWTKLLEVKNPIQTTKWEEALLNAAYCLWSRFQIPTELSGAIFSRIPNIIPISINVDDICFTVYHPGSLRFPHVGANTSTQIHFAFELQEGINYGETVAFLRTIATEHFEVNHHVTTLSIAITKKNDKNIVVAMDTVHNEIELAFLLQSLDHPSYFGRTHPILQRVFSRMIIAYLSKESIQYVEESTTDPVYKRVGFVCNEDGSIKGHVLGENEEGYGDWDVIVPDQVVNSNYYKDVYGLNDQRRSTMTTHEQRLGPCRPTPASVDQVLDYTTRLTMEYFRSEMTHDVNFYIKMQHFLTDIHNFAMGKK